MPYHVGRNGQQFGEFTEQEIREGLARGTFLASDLTWRDGMMEWQPLDQVFGFAAAQSLSAPMTALGPAAMGAGLPAMSSANVGIGVMPAPGTAIASLVLGILSLVTFFMCFVGGALAIPGVICGHMALGQIRRSGGLLQGRGMALAGVVTSYTTIAIGLVMVLFFGIIFGVAAASGQK